MPGLCLLRYPSILLFPSYHTEHLFLPNWRTAIPRLDHALDDRFTSPNIQMRIHVDESLVDGYTRLIMIAIITPVTLIKTCTETALPERNNPDDNMRSRGGISSLFVT